MTKNQLREVIRHLIKKELLNEALLLHPVQAAYMRGYEDGEQGKPANIQSVEDLQLYENQWDPEIAEPDIDTDTDTETEEDDYTFTPKPGSLPDVAPKATAKEMSAIAKLVAMYKAEKANLNESNKKRK
jgi:hypothetical protein